MALPLGLFRVFHGTTLSDNINLYLTRVFKLGLDFHSNVFSHLKRPEIVDLLRYYENTQFPTCGDSVRGFDSFKATGYLLQISQAFNVVIKRIAPGTRPRG